MATATSFSYAAAAECSNYASAAAAHSPSCHAPISARTGVNLKWVYPNCKRLVVLHHPNLSRASSSGKAFLLPRCYAESDETAKPNSSSSSTTSPPLRSPSTSPTAPSAPLESSSSSEPEGSGEFLKAQQRRRSQGARREADSTDWISSSLTRRFGLAGGLAWVGFLAFGVISEQIKTRTEVFLESQGTQNVEGQAEQVVLDNNVKYVDIRTGGGSSPLKGDLVLVDLKGRVASTGEVFVDTTSAKRPLAFVYGLKPYAKGVCYGLEYALQSMKAGGKRRVTVPADQCFGDAGEDLGNGVIVPGGAEIEYEVQLQRVSIAPS